ncbi:ferredoxin--NADP reductase [Rhodococcus sp. B10]|uniref:ferredoxin--NADP reductase n=1 Tax=Rhodococcus sp. B10 TaxID=2695876 RepID=UPI00142F9CE5|nr:ferredoxin--NADP reductase [Rhodococcus sp. B10]NIL74004.1 3-ketosteroid-9-alpha-monooxygenase, ferredoxin reductase component [Rhodococcus sp. B10]
MATADARRGNRSLLLRVAEVVDETPEARSLVFDPPDTFEYLPGQFLTVRIPSERTGAVARCYSLSSSPHRGEPPKVTVKRTYDGYGSNWVCDNVEPGDTIEVLPPSGRFTPKDLDDDFLLVAAGSGITPIMSILKSALSEGIGTVTLFYANRNENSVIFSNELRTLAAEYPRRLTVVHWLESLQGIPTVDQLATFAAPCRDRCAFVCGPGPFMDAAVKALASSGFPRNRVRREIFTSLVGDPFATVAEAEVAESPAQADDAVAVVELDGGRHTLAWPRDRTLVDIMLAEGIDVPYSCREGECGSCACTMVGGEVAMENTDVLDEDDIADGMILGCQARPVSDRVEIRF